jgi:hypothetical protein
LRLLSVNKEEVKILVTDAMPLWVSILGNFGFPIALAVYLLIRFEKKIERLVAMIQELEKSVRKKD